MGLQRFAALVCLLSCSVTACRSSATGGATFTYDLAQGPQGWSGGFADLRPGQESFFELVSDYRSLLPPLGPGSALFISGNNHSDDLFMYFVREGTGLAPNATYDVTSEVQIATSVPRGCGGVGGSPGESVYLKAGAATDQPRVEVDEIGILRLTVDKGNQATSGRDLVALGTIENSRGCELSALVWELKTLRSPAHASTVRASPAGSVWLVVGTDSGFEATTSLYYTRIVLTLDPVQ